MWNVPLPSFTTIEMVVPSAQALGGGSDVFLELNLATSVVGHCRIGILADGASIAGFGLQDADPVSGDWLQARASWARAQRSGLKHLVGTVVQLQVEMVDMKLFSVNWVAGPAHAKIVKTDDGVVAATSISSPRGHDRIGTRRPRKEVGCYWYYLVANGTSGGYTNRTLASIPTDSCTYVNIGSICQLDVQNARGELKPRISNSASCAQDTLLAVADARAAKAKLPYLHVRWLLFPSSKPEDLKAVLNSTAPAQKGGARTG